jgi:hypothetical protein
MVTGNTLITSAIARAPPTSTWAGLKASGAAAAAAWAEAMCAPGTGCAKGAGPTCSPRRASAFVARPHAITRDTPTEEWAAEAAAGTAGAAAEAMSARGTGSAHRVAVKCLPPNQAAISAKHRVRPEAEGIRASAAAAVVATTAAAAGTGAGRAAGTAGAAAAAMSVRGTGCAHRVAAKCSPPNRAATNAKRPVRPEAEGTRASAAVAVEEATLAMATPAEAATVRATGEAAGATAAAATMAAAEATGPAGGAAERPGRETGRVPDALPTSSPRRTIASVATHHGRIMTDARNERRAARGEPDHTKGGDDAVPLVPGLGPGPLAQGQLRAVPGAGPVHPSRGSRGRRSLWWTKQAEARDKEEGRRDREARRVIW